MLCARVVCGCLSGVAEEAKVEVFTQSNFSFKDSLPSSRGWRARALPESVTHISCGRAMSTRFSLILLEGGVGWFCEFRAADATGLPCRFCASFYFRPTEYVIRISGARARGVASTLRSERAQPEKRLAMCSCKFNDLQQRSSCLRASVP